MFEKIGDYKKAMKKFVKGCVKSKLFQDEDGNMEVLINKTYEKDTNTRTVSLAIENDGYTAIFDTEVSTRVYNKVDAELFAPLAAQLEKTKTFGKLIVK